MSLFFFLNLDLSNISFILSNLFHFLSSHCKKKNYRVDASKSTSKNRMFVVFHYHDFAPAPPPFWPPPPFNALLNLWHQGLNLPFQCICLPWSILTIIESTDIIVWLRQILRHFQPAVITIHGLQRPKLKLWQIAWNNFVSEIWGWELGKHHKLRIMPSVLDLVLGWWINFSVAFLSMYILGCF